jgi:3-hydroxymyristoyl/3-hydroxydecanoyl-(acyl carrier protein) dehydratase
MRYRFVDEVVSLDLGEAPRIEVSKTFPPWDDAFSGPAGPHRVPNSLILELLAMTGGHLIHRHLDSSRLPLLLKVPECRFERSVAPGVRLRAAAELIGVSTVADRATLAEASGEVYAGEARVAVARLLYICVSLPTAKTRTGEDPR